MPIYKPLKANAEIDAETALLQAAAALDAAGHTAEKVNDVEGLMNVAAMWMKMSDTITNFTEYVEQKVGEQGGSDVFKTSPKIEVGFQRAPVEPEIIVEEEENEDV